VETQSAYGAIVRPVGALVLTPLVVLAGLVALVVVLMLGATRRVHRVRRSELQRPLAPVITLDTTSVDVALRRAA
jgi:multisubunit Na+/H+ antiporter MnhC subunit